MTSDIFVITSIDISFNSSFTWPIVVLDCSPLLFVIQHLASNLCGRYFFITFACQIFSIRHSLQLTRLNQVCHVWSWYLIVPQRLLYFIHTRDKMIPKFTMAPTRPYIFCSMGIHFYSAHFYRKNKLIWNKELMIKLHIWLSSLYRKWHHHWTKCSIRHLGVFLNIFLPLTSLYNIMAGPIFSSQIKPLLFSNGSIAIARSLHQTTDFFLLPWSQWLPFKSHSFHRVTIKQPMWSFQYRNLIMFLLFLSPPLPPSSS